jgi:hypothetical protein
MAVGERRVRKSALSQSRVLARTTGDSAYLRPLIGSSMTARSAPVPVIAPPTPAARSPPPSSRFHCWTLLLSLASLTLGNAFENALPLAISVAGGQDFGIGVLSDPVFGKRSDQFGFAVARWHIDDRKISWLELLEEGDHQLDVGCEFVIGESQLVVPLERDWFEPRRRRPALNS